MRFHTMITALTITLLAGATQADEVTRFTATINNLGAIAPGGSTSTETGMSGVGIFTLSEPSAGSPTLAYELLFEGVDFVGDDGDPGNDVTAIHFHDTTGVDHSAATPHVLNIFGFPALDDDDMAFEPAAARVTGVWDDADLSEGMLAGNPMGNSDTLTSMLPALKAGELFVMLHTSSPDALPGGSGITIGGQIVAVPEPGAALLGLLALAAGLLPRRGR
ncbi:CHRD domain protein [Planctomycetes bacterium MalM25]|nr:CHRD domain protein [Planctomycetes bacterium MalM25]